MAQATLGRVSSIVYSSRSSTQGDSYGQSDRAAHQCDPEYTVLYCGLRDTPRLGRLFVIILLVVAERREAAQQRHSGHTSTLRRHNDRCSASRLGEKSSKLMEVAQVHNRNRKQDFTSHPPTCERQTSAGGSGTHVARNLKIGDTV